jgi:hypothetical protein
VAHPGGIGDDRIGPVAESVDARAVHRSLSWFKSRPGLQPSLLRSFGWQASHDHGSATRLGKPANDPTGLPRRSSKSEGGKMPVDEAFKTLSRLRNLV